MGIVEAGGSLRDIRELAGHSKPCHDAAVHPGRQQGKVELGEDDLASMARATRCMRVPEFTIVFHPRMSRIFTSLMTRNRGHFSYVVELDWGRALAPFLRRLERGNSSRGKSHRPRRHSRRPPRSPTRAMDLVDHISLRSPISGSMPRVNAPVIPRLAALAKDGRGRQKRPRLSMCGGGG